MNTYQFYNGVLKDINADKKVLITGASGFLGWNLANLLSDKHSVVGLVHTNRLVGQKLCFDLLTGDITDEKEMLSLTKSIKPDIIVHAAAMTKPDLCQREPLLAENVNVYGTEVITKAAEVSGSSLIYISTDLVFDGAKGMYNEDDAVNPLMCYAETKFLGEEKVRAWGGPSLIFRIAVMYGFGGPCRKSFLDWLIGGVLRGENVKLFTDQYRSMLYIHQLSLLIEKTLENMDTWRLFSGEVFHVGGGERINRYDFGMKVAKAFSLPPGRVCPVKMSEVPCAAARPVDCSLDTSKVERAFNMHSYPVSEGLSHLADRGLPYVF